MFELAIPLNKVHEAPVSFPAEFDGRRLDLSNMWVQAWGHRTPTQPSEGEPHNYRLYPLEFTHQPGVYIFGIKEDMTPQCYDPSFRIVIDAQARTYQVTEMSLHWESLLEDLEPAELPVAIFNFQ